MGTEHTSTLNTVNILGTLCKIVEAEVIYRRALNGYINARGSGHPSTRLF